MEESVGFTRAKTKQGTGLLYSKVVSLIKSKVDSGEWASGTQLPSLDELAVQFGVSRVTVRQAMSILEAEGQIWRRQGLGTFIAADAGKRYSISVNTDWTSLVDGIKGSNTLQLEAFTTGCPETSEEPQQGGDTYRFMRRLLSRDGTPLVLIELYLVTDIYRLAPSEFDTRPVLHVIDQFKRSSVGAAKQTLTVTNAGITTAQFLQIEVGAPVVQVKRTIHDETGRLIYLANLRYRADRYCLEMNIKV